MKNNSFKTTGSNYKFFTYFDTIENFSMTCGDRNVVFFSIKRNTKHKPPHSKSHPRGFHRLFLSVLSQHAFDKYLSFVRNDILYHDLFFNHMFFYEYRKVTNTNNNMLKIKLQTMKTHIINLLSFLNTKYLV